MKFLPLLPVLLAAALVGSVPTTDPSAVNTEDNEVQSTRQGRTFDEIIPFFKKLFSKDNEEIYDYEDNIYQKNEYTRPWLAELVRDLLRFGSLNGLTRKVRSLDGKGVFELISTAEETYRNFTRVRTGRTLSDAVSFLNEDSKINGHMKRKFDELFSGHKAESLAVAGGIAVGITAIVLLAMLVTQLKIVKAAEADSRSVKIFNNWAMQNEIEDTIPLISAVHKAIGNEGVTSRTFHEVEPFFEEVKEFFTENKLFHKFGKLYRSDAVTPTVVLGGVGAGLIGALGLGLLAASLKETSRSGRARNLDNNADLDAAYQGFNQLADAITNKITALAETQSRRGRVLEEPRTLNVTGLVSKFTDFTKKGELKNKVDKFFKGQSPLAITGGLAAGAIGITALGLLIAALVKADKDFDDDYDGSFEEPNFTPGFNGFQGLSRPARETNEVPTRNKIQAVGITDVISRGLNLKPCQAADYCENLRTNSGDIAELAQFLTGQDQKNSVSRALAGILDAAKKNDCYKYVCL